MKTRFLFALVLVTLLSLALMTTATAAGPNNWSVSAAFVDNSGCNTTTLQCKTIQAAVTAASAGDFLFIAPGTYAEQVTIGKNLTVVGAGASNTTIQAPATLVNDALGMKTIVEVNNGATVWMSGLTVNGPGPSNCGSITYGIYVIGNATLNLSGATINNIRDNPLSGCQNGAGVRVGQATVTPAQVGHATISNVTITNYQKGGIVIDGAGTTATVKNSTVTGVGATTMIAQNGIQVSRGAVASIYGNTVTGNLCDHSSCGPALDVYQSAGILLYEAGTGTSVIGNNVSNNDSGINLSNVASAPTVLTVSANTVTGNRYEGIYVGSNNNDINAAISNNTITGPSNIGLAIDTATGKAFGNTITGNTVGVKWASMSGPTVVVNFNVISGNTSLGADNATTTNADATKNWWGSAAGPGAGGNNGVGSHVTATPFAQAQITSTTNSTHEVGESTTLNTSVTANGLYGVQLVVNHTPSILTWQSGTKNNAGSAPNDWNWTGAQIARDFVPNSPAAGQTQLAASLRRDNHPNAANLSNGNIATWTYQCAAVGISPLVYDATAQTGTLLSDKNGMPIWASFAGGSINCLAASASTAGVIGLQGRTQGATAPAGWNGAVVTLTCASGDCLGYGPYVFPATDVNGNYQIVKAGPGTGVATGTYLATVTRRAYLGAAKTNVAIVAGSNTLPQANLLGGEVTNDGVIDVSDLALVGGAFGNTVTADTGADVNGDGIVNILDLVLAGGNYGLSSPQTW